VFDYLTLPLVDVTKRAFPNAPNTAGQLVVVLEFNSVPFGKKNLEFELLDGQTFSPKPDSFLPVDLKYLLSSYPNLKYIIVCSTL